MSVRAAQRLSSRPPVAWIASRGSLFTGGSHFNRTGMISAVSCTLSPSP